MDGLPEGLVVTPDVLRTAGGSIVRTADELHRNVSELVGMQEGAAHANGGFAMALAVADCESGWEQVLLVSGTRIAVAGDNVSVSAAGYLSTEDSNTHRLRPR